MKAVFLLVVASLAGCATGVDRHGRPIDPSQPLTRDTSPDPGRKPSIDEATTAIRASRPESKTAVAIRSIREGAHVTPLGAVHSGWIVCYRFTGENFIGQVVSAEGAALVRTAKDGSFEAWKGYSTASCR